MKKISLLLIFLLVFSFMGCDNTPACVISGKHTDENSDTRCDACNASVLIEFDFFAINDLHGKFDDTSTNEGVDELTTYIKLQEKQNDNVVLISQGDMWQGSSESNLTYGYIITEWMNELDFVSMTLGNHEYDWGEEKIRENLEIAEFPFLAINVYNKDTHTRVDYATPSVMIEEDGIKIGIIGAMGDCYSSISREMAEDIYFKTGDELTALVKSESIRLRNAGADFIIYSIHDGYSSSSSHYDYSLSQGYVDLVLEGHTHQKYIKEDNHGVYHIQSGGENEGISHVEVKFNTVTGKVHVKKPEFVSTSVYANLGDSPIVNSLLEKYEDEIAKADVVLGYNSSKRDSRFITDLIAKLYTEWGVRQYGEEFDIVLGGGYLKLRSPYYLYTGEVKYSDVQTILPFDNALTLCSVKGRDLKSKFIYSDNSAYHVYYTEYGKGVKNNIDEDATYYVIVDTYTATYAPNRLTIIHRFDEGFYARDLLAEYIKGGGLK